MNDQASNPQSYRDDEIDLRKLFQAIGNFFIGIGHGFINLILAFRRITFKYKYLLLVAIVLGAVVGISYKKIVAPYYKTSLLLKSSYLNTQLVENSIDKLNLLCAEKDRTGLANVLGVSDSVAENIVDFEYEPFVEENTIVEVELLKQKLEALKIDKADIERIVNQISIQNRNTFSISVHILNTDIIENLESAIVNFFKNNPYIANRIKTNKTRQEQLIAKLSHDVALLDSLKDAYNLNLRLSAGKSNDASNSVILGESGAVDPVRVYDQGVNLFQQLLYTKRSYELGTDFELVDGFTTFTKPDSASVIKTLVLSIAVLLVLAYGIIFLMELNTYLNRIEKEGFK